MSSRLFLLISFVLSFLQGSILPAVFSEGILIVFLSLQRPTLKVSPFVALGGFFFDLIQNGRLGITSLLFLVSIFFLYLLREQIQIQKALSLSLLAVLISIARWQIVFGYINWGSCFASFIVAFILLYFFWHPVMGSRIKV